ncbi:MAG: TonB-dependent receptor [Bacteroidetes bacterium]|nr:MAG: TonB-dependent receptor [Bacteroidota bacterium]
MKFFRWSVVLCLGLMMAGTLSAQTELRGTVTDLNEETLTGASIYIEGTRRGTISDENGKYSFEGLMPGEYTVVFSFIGHKTERVPVTVVANSARFLLNMRLKEEAYTLQSLEVLAVRADNKTPMTNTDISKEIFEKNNLGQDVPYLLQWTPSVVVTSDAGTGIGYTGIRIRGSDSERVNVTINDIPLNDAESQRVYWVDLPDFATSADNIQIQRGVGTSTNGVAAFGGSINIKTNDLQQNPYASIGTTLGSFNTFKRNIRFGSGMLKDKFTFDGRIARITSDGYVDRGSADLDAFALSGAYVGENSLLRFNIFSGHEVTYQAWNGVSEEQANDPKMRTYNSAGEDMPGENNFYDNEVDDYTQTHYQLLYDNQLNANLKLKLGLHLTKGKGFYENYRGEESFSDYNLDSGPVPEEIETTDLVRRKWLDNNFYGAIYNLSYSNNSQKFQATVGGAYHIYEGRHFGDVIWARYSINEMPFIYYDNDATKKDFNIYTKLNFVLMPGLNAYADLQFRSVNYEFLGIDDDLNNVKQSDELSFFNPKAGLIYQLNRNNEVYASFAVANREPNRNDYTENPVSQRPNPERLYNTELGYKWTTNKSLVEVVLYHMSYKDQLALTGRLNDVGEYTRINVDKSYRAGIELIGGMQLPAGFAFNANATLSQNKVVAFTNYVDNWDTWAQEAVDYEDTDLPFSPNLIAGAELTYQLFNAKMQEKHNLELALQYKYVGKQFLDLTSDDNLSLDPYGYANLRIKYDLFPGFAKEISLTVMVRNLFDQLYVSNGWSYSFYSGGELGYLTGLYPQAGRNFLVGVNVAF